MEFKSDLHAGRAGEHLAVFDIFSKGFDCFPAAQGMPYDLVLDDGGNLLKVQVKTTRKPSKMANRQNMQGYCFNVRKCGKHGRKMYAKEDVDIFALVALDSMEVGYISVGKMPITLYVRPESLRGTYDDERVAARNRVVYEKILNGEPIQKLANEFNLDDAYLYRLKKGRARTFVSGFYLRDLTLDSALQSLAVNDNERIGSSKKSFLDEFK